MNNKGMNTRDIIFRMLPLHIFESILQIKEDLECQSFSAFVDDFLIMIKTKRVIQHIGATLLGSNTSCR